VCGLWHGAARTFVVWGALHGLFMVLEHAGLGTFIKKVWSPLRHIYLLFIVMVGWVLFRSDTLHYAAGYLRAMFGFSPGNTKGMPFSQLVNPLVIVTLLGGLAAAFAIAPGIVDLRESGGKPSDRPDLIFSELGGRFRG